MNGQSSHSEDLHQENIKKTWESFFSVSWAAAHPGHAASESASFLAYFVEKKADGLVDITKGFVSVILHSKKASTFFLG